jgi:murein DD-endopeptidase MepM/ murein hydrolase activator NlpD
MGILGQGAIILSRAFLTAGFCIWLICGPNSKTVAAHDVRSADASAAAEQRLLGDDDEAARFAACQPFTREIVVEGAVEGSFDASLAAAGMPAAEMLEVQRALAASIDLGREVAAGDHFYIRYKKMFTAEGAPIGVGRVIWAEVVTRTRAPIAIHRFRPLGGIERFWLTNGEAATAPSMRMPLDAVVVSSGFGMRADPFDQPPPNAREKRPPMGGPERSAGGVSGKGLPVNAATARGIALGLLPRPGFTPQAQGAHALFMHEGIDLAAPIGTPIYAASDGVVVGAGPNAGYGNWVRIDHLRKLSTVYGHLSEFAPGLQEGLHISRGELIGFVGSTGRSTGPHLHFEILSNGKAVDPLVYSEIKREQLGGADLERFRNQVKHARAERDLETTAGIHNSVPGIAYFTDISTR